MNIISLKDYAEQKNISYEAVRKQVVRYKNELEGHVIRDGRQQFLDDEAVTFLDSKREKNPVIIVQTSKDDRIKELEHDNLNLLNKVAAQADKIAALSEWKADNALAIAEADHRKLLLEEAEKKIEGFAEEKQKAVEEAVKETQDQAEKEKEAAVEEAIRLVKEEHEDKLKKMSVWEFLREKRRKQ